MNNKTIVKWGSRAVLATSSAVMAGALWCSMHSGMQQATKAEKETGRINNPVLICNRDVYDGQNTTILYEGTQRNRSRGLKEIGEFKHMLIVPDLDNSTQPYAEIEKPGLIEARQATLHIGRNQPLPMYESLGNGGCFDW